MFCVTKEKWLLLDDCRTDRVRAEQAIATWADVEIIPAATLREVSETLSREHVSLCLLDFHIFKSTSEELIARIRSEFLHLPIVVVSGVTGRDGRLYKAGADAIVPKVTDMSAFAESLRTAVCHARAIRRLGKSRVKWRQPWLGERIKVEFKKVASRRTGHVAIVASAGMGRTSVARALADRIRASDPVLYGGEVRSLACAAFDSKKPEAFDEALFGSATGREDSLLQKGLLAASQGAVLVIDDAHLLPKSTQKRLKAFFECGTMVSEGGQTIDATKTRIIFTSLPAKEVGDGLIPGFLQATVATCIRVPDFTTLARHKRKILSFWFKRNSSELRKPRMRADATFVQRLFAAVDEAPNRVTMRSFSKTVEMAIAQAISENRTLVTAVDLGEMAFLYESNTTHRPTVSEKDHEELQSILSALNSATLEEATQLIRRLRFEKALLQAHGSKSKAASFLGISRGTLYREFCQTESSCAL